MKYSDKDKAAYYKKKSQVVAKSRSTKGKSYYKYPGAGRNIGRAAGYAIGESLYPGLGGPIGGALGAVTGRGAHALVRRITGFGDYHVSKNSLVYNVDAVPEFSNNNERCTMIVHREFITDVVGSVGFVNNSYRINPGLSTTFPWLASMAENYEQYVIQGMVFEFKTTCATAVSSTNTALGTVVMATQYNSLATPFSSKQQMENYEFSQSSVPSASLLHPIECDPTQTQCGGIFNVTDDLTVSSNGDIRLYDIGRFNIATVGMQAAATIGELWVSYKICFLKPRLRTNAEGMDMFIQEDPASVVIAKPFGNYGTLIPLSPNAGVVQPISDNDFQVDTNFVGILQCLIVYEVSTATTAFSGPYWTSGGGAGTTDVSFTFTGITPTTALANTISAASGNDAAYAIAYFKFIGGDGPGSVTPYVSVSNLSITGTCDNVRVSFLALPSSFYNFSF